MIVLWGIVCMKFYSLHVHYSPLEPSFGTSRKTASKETTRAYVRINYEKTKISLRG